MLPISKIVTFSAAIAWAVLAFNAPQFAPPNAKPVAMEASDAGFSIDAGKAIRGIAQHRDTIRREPLSAPALRDLALAYAGGEFAAAQGGLEHAERVTRRDQWSQLFLIEGSVEQGRIGPALQRYDTLLVLGSELTPLLLRQLSAGVASPEIRQQLRPYAQRPWMHRLLQTAATGTADPMIPYGLAQDLGLLSAELPDETVRRLVAALITKGHYAEAAAVADKVAEPGGRRWRDFGFSGAATQPRLSPLTWDIASNAGLMVTLDTSRRLNVVEISGEAAVVASRVLALPPRGYALTLAIEGNDSRLSDFRLEVTCLGETSTAAAPVSATYAAGIMTARFTLPNSCGLQMVQIMYRPDDHQGSRQFWLGPLALVPGSGLQ
jgi:hypothetical protein